MFTGIVEGVGKVESLVEEKESWCLTLSLPFEGNDGLEAGCQFRLSMVAA
jgi:riboflavin synthase alpha subunit